MKYDVTHIIPYMHPRSGGPPVVVDRLCRRLAQRKWRVRVVTTDTMAGTANDDWACVYRAGYPLDIYHSRGPGSYSFSRALRSDMSGIVDQTRLVHVHTAWTYPGLLALQAARRLGRPAVVMPHGMLDPNSLNRQWLKKQVYGRLVEWPQLRRTAGMIYTHPTEQRLAEESVSGLPAGYIVPLGTDPPPDEPKEDLAAEFYAEYPQLKGRRLVVFLSRLHPKKGLDLLIPAFRQVAAVEPNAHLILVGHGDRGYLSQLERWVDEHRLGDHITFAGPRTGRNKWSALAAGELFALPSYQENFGLVLVEAMRMGLPLVLTDRVNIWPEIVEAGAGRLCRLEPGSVAESVLAILSDSNRRAKAGAAALNLVHSRFSWEHSIDQLENAYRAVLGEGPAVEACGVRNLALQSGQPEVRA